jgi:ElaB/YqjD/DUF883 family membrane-anchored ribosome-binding protein
MGIVNEAAVRAHNAVDQAAEAAAPAEDLMSGACAYVTAHPLRSLGLALAAGYLISRLTRS